MMFSCNMTSTTSSLITWWSSCHLQDGVELGSSVMNISMWAVPSNPLKMLGIFQFLAFNKLSWLVVWLPFVIFPYIGLLIIPNDFHIFQRGSNHQPVRVNMDPGRSGLEDEFPRNIWSYVQGRTLHVPDASIQDWCGLSQSMAWVFLTNQWATTIGVEILYAWPLRSNQQFTLQTFAVEESYDVVIATQQNMVSGFVPLHPLFLFFFRFPGKTSNYMDHGR